MNVPLITTPKYDDFGDFEPYFSWHQCENCGSTLGGNRYDVESIDELQGEPYESSVCEDCFLLLCS